MHKLFILTGTVAGALSVMIGAFGAHKLKDFLVQTNRLDVFETAVKYQFYHTLALLFTGLLIMKAPVKTLDYAGYCFIAGMLVFSGSLYILCLTQVRTWGAVTPIGGVLLIAGWICLFMGSLKAL